MARPPTASRGGNSMRSMRAAVIGFLALGAVAALAAPATAALAPSELIDMTASRHDNGPFVEVVRANCDGQGDVKTVHLRVKSLTGDREGAILQREQPFGIKMKFFKPSGENITAEVTSLEGYEFNVKKPKRFRLQLKATIPDPF